MAPAGGVVHIPGVDRNDVEIQAGPGLAAGDKSSEILSKIFVCGHRVAILRPDCIGIFSADGSNHDVPREEPEWSKVE